MSIAKKIGLGVEVAIGDTSDVILVPGDDTSTGNVTGGRKLAPLCFRPSVGLFHFSHVGTLYAAKAPYALRSNSSSGWTSHRVSPLRDAHPTEIIYGARSVLFPV